jgi:ABC-type transport system involved in cytochrome bd biosynthesis fused ATPase/permease subunit
MSNSVYKINKGINKPIEFKGFKAQYIWYLGIGLVALLILFAVLYIIGVNTYMCLFLIIILGSILFIRITKLSNKYGEHGMMKKIARQGVPRMVKSYSRKMFMKKEKNK